MTSLPHTGIILFAHGSRDPAWKAPMERVAALIRGLSPDTPVLCAYLELDQPDLHTACKQLLAEPAQIKRLRILPMFLGMGRHARHDLPALVCELQATHPGTCFEVLPSVGESEQLLELTARLALQSTEA